MSRRHIVLLLILSLVFVPLAAVPVQAQANVLRVAAHFWAIEDRTGFKLGDQSVDLMAYRDTTFGLGGVVSQGSFFRLYMLGPGGAADGVLIMESAVPLPGDPDWISVSDDLGWAGIDTTVPLLDRNSGELVEVEIHVYWWAETETLPRSVNGRTRGARVEGTITVHGPRGFTVTLPDSYELTWNSEIFTQFEA